MVCCLASSAGGEQRQTPAATMVQETACLRRYRNTAKAANAQHDAERFGAARQVGYGFGLHRVQQEHRGGKTGQQIAPRRIGRRPIPVMRRTIRKTRPLAIQ